MIVGETLAYNARNNPESEALIFGNQRRTWTELNEGANRFANALTKLGAKKGDRVLMMVDNSIEFVEIYYGLSKIGVISAPALPRSVGAEITYIVNDLRAQYVVVESSAAAAVREVQSQLKTVRHVIGIGDNHGMELDYDEVLRNASPAEPEDAQISPFDDLTIKYTSGTTGAPKGCVRTHSNFVMAAAVALSEQPLYKNDTASITSPLAAGMAISELTKYLINGVRTVMLGRFDPVQYMEAIAREKITWGYAMDTMARRFAMHPDLDKADLSSLRAFSGSQYRDAMDKLLAHPTFHAGFHSGYGSSEAGGRISFKNPDDYTQGLNDPGRAHILNSLGREGRLFHMAAVDDDLRPVPVGEIGELAIRGPSVFKGYWERPEETAKVLRDGWLVTGDLCRRDAEGYIYLAGRKRDMIKTGGINVYPAEIEPVISKHEQVAEVSVVGIPDAEWGEKVIACVVAKGPVTEKEIIDFCRDKLAGHKRPKVVHFLDRLPVNESGKVVKKDLVTLLTQPSTK